MYQEEMYARIIINNFLVIVVVFKQTIINVTKLQNR